MQMVADDQRRLNRIQMTAVQESTVDPDTTKACSNGRLWDNTMPAAVGAFMAANFSFVQSY